MRKFIEDAVVVLSEFVAENTFILKIKTREIARYSLPGQFCEIETGASRSILWRRPFSISNVEGDDVEFMIDVVGAGTERLSKLGKGDKVNILGPLGNGFDFSGGFETAVIVSGGIGYAPFPFLYKKLIENGKKTIRIAGFSSSAKIPRNLEGDFFISTDDGSEGFRGNVLQLAEKTIENLNLNKIKAFACGPLPMLRAAKRFFEGKNIELEIAAETEMACGSGLCQGCAIPKSKGNGFLLVCKDGPVFNSKEIIL